MASDNRFAVLIDADNVSVKYIKIILDEISKDGIATYKRIYGDWTNPSLISWKSTLLDNSIIPVQQYSYTTGKNSTDSAMIIDAMDILYSGRVEGFCLVSSDSDFTRLAARLRESGMTVIGMGESKTPNSFIAACNKFKYLDILSAADEAEAEEAAPKAEPAKKPAAQPGAGKFPVRTCIVLGMVLIICILALGILCTLGANGFYVKATAYIDTTSVSILSALEVVVGSIVGFLVFHESMRLSQVIGALTIMVGALLPNVREKLRSRKTA